MGVGEEEAVRAFLTEAEGEKWDAAQIERLLDRMAPDIHYHVYAWEQPVVGRQAVRAELLRQAPLFRDFRCEVMTVASADHTVLVERRDSYTVGGRALTGHAVGAFDVDADGKIAAWRDYYDSKEIAVKLGADVSKVSTAGVRGFDS